jgi:hypothetical protein
MAYTIIGNTERYYDSFYYHYIEDNMLNNNQKYILKFLPLAIEILQYNYPNRACNLKDITKNDISSNKWSNILDKISDDTYEKKIEKLNIWMKKYYPDYTHEQLTNFEKVKVLMLMFYNNDIWGLCINVGPLNYESTYILDELKQFVNYNFIPTESQPGLSVNNKYIQIPYIRLISLKSNFNKLFTILQQNKKYNYIGVLDYRREIMDNNTIIQNVYDKDLYTSYMFGIDLQYVPQNNIIEIFTTNKFFTDLLEAIRDM